MNQYKSMKFAACCHFTSMLAIVVPAMNVDGEGTPKLMMVTFLGLLLAWQGWSFIRNFIPLMSGEVAPEPPQETEPAEAGDDGDK
ncbi:TPA: hypothetical protein ACPWIG_005213 [Pseudomonas aeruginosa]|uniref:hypothetical protein n=1 Tax=Pseudomonas aeruginosa TaxID=287 RepID=UPI000E330F00|nr:hypothetical protein [Pseudomonas aeruginosa]SYY08097.1 Uncharacterised protein [Acinetobacter baumannii]MDP2556097.1 hypothetical protein [Pseudomonas aeruginosa]QPN17970.1 hypothetical protein I5U70_32950 [Pseudomonas aeruginosa]HBN8448304.1 hypothetical protein [Pseudomonas aeruginosa]HEP9428472.1 hypothetical protein [Pseudomonas aeruginosa]